jgi:hypothetical protein
MEKAIPQAAGLYEWDSEPLGGVGNPTNEGQQGPIKQYIYSPRPSVVKAIEAKLKEYFRGKNVEYEPHSDCDSTYSTMGFFVRSPNWMEYMILVQPNTYICNTAVFKAASRPSSTQQQRDAAKALLDGKMKLTLSKFMYDPVDDDQGEPTRPSQKEFDDVFKLVTDVATDAFENPTGGRRKKRKTRRLTRKKLRR